MIGSNAFVGEGSVIDIDTAMGDNTQLGHASSLLSGQQVPEGKRYHGVPAVETASDYCPIESRECTVLRRALYSVLQCVPAFLIAVPGSIVATHLLGQYAVAAGLSSVSDISTLTLLGISAAVFFGALIFRLATIYAIPRLCSLLLKPGVTYPAYGIHHAIQRFILHGTNSRFFCLLFGDSSAVVHYMRYVGWTLNKIRQTGSNMGANQRHDNPLLCNVGSGTMVSDGLSMINTHMSATSFKLAEARIGEENYLGNAVLYPPDGRTGANVLIGTKTLIPIDGPMRENVGLLGSPAFEIPRVVDRDRDFMASIGRKDAPRAPSPEECIQHGHCAHIPNQ